MLLLGVGFALAFPALNMQATAGVADHEQGLASGLVNTSFQVGGAIVLAVASAIVASQAGAVDRSAGAARRLQAGARRDRRPLVRQPARRALRRGHSPAAIGRRRHRRDRELDAAKRPPRSLTAPPLPARGAEAGGEPPLAGALPSFRESRDVIASTAGAACAPAARAGGNALRRWRRSRAKAMARAVVATRPGCCGRPPRRRRRCASGGSRPSPAPAALSGRCRRRRPSAAGAA